MKKLSIAVAMMSFALLAGCASSNSEAVNRDHDQNNWPPPQQQFVRAKMAYLPAAQYDKTPGDVAGKCYGQVPQVVKYISSPAEKTPPPANHPVWLHVASLNCANNTDQNGSYRLFSNNAAMQETAAIQKQTVAEVSAGARKGVTLQRLPDPSKGRGEYAGKLYCIRKNVWERQIMQYNSDPRPPANHPVYAYVDSLQPSNGSCSKGDQEAYMLFPSVPVDTPVPNPVVLVAQPNVKTATAVPAPVEQTKVSKPATKKAMKKARPAAKKASASDVCTEVTVNNLGYKSVAEFQKANGLKADGIVGSATVAKLVEAYKAKTTPAPAPATKK